MCQPQHLGWQAVAVPFYEWWRLPPAQRGPYMRRKLQQAGLSLEGGRDRTAAGPAEVPDGQQRQAADGAAQQPPAEPAAASQEHQQQQPATAGQSSPEQEGAAGAADMGPAAGLSQRAQRLSMMQYKKGKLSKAGLLARGSLQAAAAGGASSDTGSGDGGDANNSSDGSGGSGGRPGGPAAP